MRLFATSSFGTIILAFALVASILRAEDYPTIGSQEDEIAHGAIIINPGDESRFNIPKDSWEKRSNGISIAMIVKNAGLQGAPKARIDVYIKNVSDSDKHYFAPNNEIFILYIDDKAASQPLKEVYNHPIVEENHVILIRPGQILLRTTELTPDELVLVKQHDVKCLFRIGGKDSKELKVESTPRRLSPSI